MSSTLRSGSTLENYRSNQYTAIVRIEDHGGHQDYDFELRWPRP